MGKKLVKDTSILILAIASFIVTGERTDGYGSEPSVRLNTTGTHSRLSIAVDQGVDYDWKDVPGGFELTLKGIGLIDLGARFGNESSWISKYTNLNDRRLSGLEFKETSDSVIVRGKWKFPKGDDAPFNPTMESFKYQQKEPPRFFVDFWVKDGPTVRQVRVRKQKQRKVAALEQAQKKAESRITSRAKRKRKVHEKVDPTKFCTMPISEDLDVFMRFHPAHRKVDFSKWFIMTIPDRDFPYRNPDPVNEEARYVRLAQKLYKGGKPALVLKTIEFFERDFPRSDFRQEMTFLKANAMIKLGLRDQAEQIFESLAIDEKGSTVALHASMYLAGKKFREKSYLIALEYFLSLIRKYPKHRLDWVFHLGAAECFYALKQTPRAAKEYRWVVENAPDRQAQAEAAFRIGDLYLERKQFAQGLASYFKAVSFFEKEAPEYPEVYLNRGEALYWLKQYTRAEEEFTKYHNKFEGRPEGWRATFRLAEIHGRKAGRGTNAEYRKWLLKTINSYPLSPAATLARLQIASCGDHGGFSVALAERFIEHEAEKYDGSAEVFMDRYPDYLALGHVRALVSMGAYDRAVSLIKTKLKQPLQAGTKSKLREILKLTFRGQILGFIGTGKHYEAVAFYDRYRTLLNDEFRDTLPDYLLKLSLTASRLGLGSLALKLIDDYEEINRISFPERVITKVDDSTDLDDIARYSEESFARARALWISYGKESDQEITKLLSNINDESPHLFERNLILSMLEKAKGNHSAAIEYASKAQLLIPHKEAVNRDKMDFWLATLYSNTDKKSTAVEIIDRLTKLKERAPAKLKEPSAGLGLPAIPKKSDLFWQMARIHEQESQWERAAGAYQKSIEAGNESNRVRYAFARALEKTQEKEQIARAMEQYKKISESEKEDFWKELAQQKLAPPQ